MRAVPVPSALFEPPTAADIDKALSVLEERGGPAPPFTPTVVRPEVSQPLGEDEPTRVFDSTASQEFSANEAITGPAQVLPETGIPIETPEGGEGELTERRFVDPADGQVKASDQVAAALNGRAAAGKAREESDKVDVSGAAAAAVLDAPISTLVDSGSAPAAKAPAPPAMKPAAPSTAKPAAPMARVTAGGVPVRITTDRPTATESGRFRSDARYKRGRGKGLSRAIALVVLAGGLGTGGVYLKRQHDRKAAANALAAAAAAEAAAKAAPPPTTPPEGAETAAGSAGAAPNPMEAAGTPETGKTEKPTVAEANTETKAEKPAKPEKQDVGKSSEKSQGAAEKPEGSSSGRSRRRERASASATQSAKPVAQKPEEAAGTGDKHPGDEAKASGDSAKSGETTKEAAKPSETAKTGEGEKSGEAARSEKMGEAAAASAVTERPVLKITSSPAGADIVIDGVPVGTTPFSSRDVTADATHAISVKKDGYETHERMISGSDWSRGKGGAQSLKVNVKLKRAAGEKPPAADTGEKKPPDVEILTPSEP
jgi:hypothetical protein